MRTLLVCNSFPFDLQHVGSGLRTVGVGRFGCTRSTRMRSFLTHARSADGGDRDCGGRPRFRGQTRESHSRLDRGDRGGARPVSAQRRPATRSGRGRPAPGRKPLRPKADGRSCAPGDPRDACFRQPLALYCWFGLRLHRSGRARKSSGGAASRSSDRRQLR